jgi:phospholipase/carboxylesterase
MENQIHTLEIDDWVVRVRTPQISGLHPVVLMLHGWTGDEESMWIFASRLPETAMLIAPRGLYTSRLGGYSWQSQSVNGWPGVEDFEPAIDKLLDLLKPENFPAGDFSNFRIVGFSQGAALTYAFALMQPEKVSVFAGLSGFLPQQADSLINRHPLKGKKAFIAHGTRDEMVEVARARKAVEELEEAGAEVTYCEDDVGHKLSLTCFKGLETFFAREMRG